MTEPAQYICAVCGARLPHLSNGHMIELGCALKRNEDQYVFFCINRHTKEEIAAAITGIPKFKKASDIKKGLA